MSYKYHVSADHPEAAVGQQIPSHPPNVDEAPKYCHGSCDHDGEVNTNHVAINALGVIVSDIYVCL